MDVAVDPIPLRLGSYWPALIGWGALIGCAILITLLIAVAARRQGRLSDRYDVPGRLWPEDPARVAQLRRTARELAAEAEAAARAAARSVDAANRARARQEEAARARDAAWDVFDAAQREYSTVHSEYTRFAGGPSGWFRTVPPPPGFTLDREPATEQPATEQSATEQSATGEPVPAEAPVSGPPDERAVARAALAAYRRGELSVDALGQVLRSTSGWDPDRERKAREVESQRARARAARQAYDAAAVADRAAAAAAEIMGVAERALLEEAAKAAVDAQLAQQAAEAWPDQRRRWPRRRQTGVPPRRPRRVSRARRRPGR